MSNLCQAFSYLNSASDLSSPQIHRGTNKTFTAYGAPTYESVKFGNGINLYGTGKYAVTDRNILDPEYGCMEAWIKMSFPSTDNWSDFSGIGPRHWFGYRIPNTVEAGSEFRISFRFEGRNYGKFRYYIGNITAALGISSAGSCPGWSTGEIVHWAITWEKNGSNGTITIYQDGVSVNSTTGAMWDTTGIGATHKVGLGIGNWGGYNGPVGGVGVYENFKLWNYAKKDFSDRHGKELVLYNSKVH